MTLPGTDTIPGPFQPPEDEEWSEAERDNMVAGLVHDGLGNVTLKAKFPYRKDVPFPDWKRLDANKKRSTELMEFDRALVAGVTKALEEAPEWIEQAVWNAYGKDDDPEPDPDERKG